MTQLEKMPPRTSTDQELIAERAREKEVAKVRLEQVCVGASGNRQGHRPRY